MSEFCYEIINIKKEYTIGKQKSLVLDNINLKLKNNEFISIMGPSGSGKSTLLYLMGGIEFPTSGDIILNGVNINKLSDRKISKIRRCDIGFIFQFYNLIPNLNVIDNILFPLALEGKKLSKYKERLEVLLQMTDLIDRRKHKPKELSGGQQQRVAIARALITEPKIILADEPTGNLDSKTSEDIMNLLQKINLIEKKTIIQVTHSDYDSNYGNRIIRLQDGRII